jgi:ribosomal protein S18 acetylase RimI-like enzyme
MIQENSLQLVSITSEFFEFVRQLRTDPRNAEAFITNDFISPENHESYMNDHLSDYFICLNGEVSVGFIGAVEGDIRLAVDYNYRNIGVASFMVRNIIQLFPNAVAKIKITNAASIALFESVGFKRQFYIYGKVEK